MNTAVATTETIARFHCAKCGVRVLFVGPEAKVREHQDAVMTEHAREI